MVDTVELKCTSEAIAPGLDKANYGASVFLTGVEAGYAGDWDDCEIGSELNIYLRVKVTEKRIHYLADGSITKSMIAVTISGGVEEVDD